MKKLFYFFAITLFLLSFGVTTYAKSDLSISETDITLSKTNPIEGDLVRVYARIFNAGDVDVLGFVSFTDNGKEMQTPQTVSVRPGTYDDVFIDWAVSAGNHSIQAKITGANPAEDILQNDSTTLKNIVVPAKTPTKTIAPAAIVNSTSNTSENNSNAITSSGSGSDSGLNSDQPNFIKSAISSLNETINAEALKYYHLALGKPQTSALAQTENTKTNWLQWPSKAIQMTQSYTQNSWFVYLGIGLLLLIIMWFVVRKFLG